MCQNPLVKTNINIAVAFLLFVFAQKVSNTTILFFLN